LLTKTITCLFEIKLIQDYPNIPNVTFAFTANYRSIHVHCIISDVAELFREHLRV